VSLVHRWSSTSHGAGDASWADAFTLAAGVLPAQDRAKPLDSIAENQQLESAAARPWRWPQVLEHGTVASACA